MSTAVEKALATFKVAPHVQPTVVSWVGPHFFIFSPAKTFQGANVDERLDHTFRVQKGVGLRCQPELFCSCSRGMKISDLALRAPIMEMYRVKDQHTSGNKCGKKQNRVRSVLPKAEPARHGVPEPSGISVRRDYQRPVLLGQTEQRRRLLLCRHRLASSCGILSTTSLQSLW